MFGTLLPAVTSLVLRRYAAARVAWERFNEHIIDSRKIIVQRHRWHKHAQVLAEAEPKATEMGPNRSRPGQAQIMPQRLWDLKST